MSEEDDIKTWVRALKPTSAAHLVTLAGMEPRIYYSKGEILAMMRGVVGVPYELGPGESVRAADIRLIGSLIDRHPGPFGQKDRPWKGVYAWATKESYAPDFRDLCIRYGHKLVKDLSIPYRRVYCEVLEQPVIAALPKEIREERARAAAVRAFLDRIYYGA